MIIFVFIGFIGFVSATNTSLSQNEDLSFNTDDDIVVNINATQDDLCNETLVSNEIIDDTNNSQNFNNNVLRSDNITINPIIYVEKGLSNSEIQSIINSANEGDTIEFMGDSYNNISLIISQNSLNILSNHGTILYGDSNPIFTISANNVTISNLTLSKGNIGIYLKSSNNVNIINNTIINNKKGIYLDNTLNTYIINNTVSYNEEGIYLGSESKYTKIINNIISYNSLHGINLAESGNYTDIYLNRFLHNNYGIFVDCDGNTDLNITNNVYQWNEIGLLIGENYRRSKEGIDFICENNVFLYNTEFNMRGSQSNYDKINLGQNYIGTKTADGKDIRTCPKVYYTPISISVEQTGTNEITMYIKDQNGNIISNLPSITTRYKVSKDSYTTTSINNGKGAISVSGSSIKIDLDGYGDNEISLDPNYQKPTQDPEPVEPNTPVTPSDNNDGNGTYVPSTSSSTSPSSVGGSGSTSVSSGSSGTSSLAASSNSESTTSAASSSTSKSTSSSTSSKTVSSLEVEDNVVRIAGLGVIFLIILLVIGMFYKNDIKYMLYRRKEKNL